MNLLGMAIAFAADAHASQLDKRGEPYILHPLRVMNAVRTAGFGEEHQIVAVFHDVREDTFSDPVAPEVFGVQVVQGVEAITRRYEPLEGRQVDEWGARKWGPHLETHWEYFLRCMEDPIARVVKFFDTLDNTSALRYSPHVPYTRYLKSLAWFQEHEPTLFERARR